MTQIPLSIYPEVGELNPLVGLFQVLYGYRELLSTSLSTPSGFRTGLLRQAKTDLGTGFKG